MQSAPKLHNVVEGSMFLWNIGNHLEDYSMSQDRGSWSDLSEPESQSPTVKSWASVVCVLCLKCVFMFICLSLLPSEISCAGMSWPRKVGKVSSHSVLIRFSSLSCRLHSKLCFLKCRVEIFSSRNIIAGHWIFYCMNEDGDLPQIFMSVDERLFGCVVDENCSCIQRCFIFDLLRLEVRLM